MQNAVMMSKFKSLYTKPVSNFFYRWIPVAGVSEKLTVHCYKAPVDVDSAKTRSC